MRNLSYLDLKESWLKATGLGFQGLRVIEVVLDQNGCYELQFLNKYSEQRIDRTDDINGDILIRFQGLRDAIRD